jgi:succinoglycan biosynthesis protein ExoA
MLHPRTDPAAELPSPHVVRPRLWDSKVPFISILVPVRNEGRCIRDTLRQLLEQDYDRNCFEVIVADGESTDDTREQVRELQQRHPNLHLVTNPGRWSSAGRNAALEIARGDLMVIIDGHCEIESRRHLADLAAAFERSNADCLGRPQPQNMSGATSLQRAIAACRASRLGHHPDSFIYSSDEQIVKASSVAVAYRREVFDLVGTFDERFDACEDVEFNHRIDRAGLTCLFSPTVGITYHPRGTLRGLFRQMTRYGRGRVRLLRKHGDTFTLPGFVPALFVLGLLVGAILAIVSTWFAWLYAGCLALYATAVLAMSATLGARERDVRVFAWAPLVFGTIHVGAGTGILLEWLKPQKPPERKSATQVESGQLRRAA